MAEDVQYEPGFAWAIAWSDGSSHPFIMVQHVAARRHDAIKRFIDVWRYNDDEPVMKSWRRAYREGARCIRVSVHAWGQPHPKPTEATDGQG